MKVVGIEASQVLAGRIAEQLRVEIVDARFSRFPDGEQYLQVGELGDETVVVGSVADSDALVQLLLLIDACEGSEIDLVIPYMGYARQDRRFQRGEPVSARAIARALSPGVRRVFTVNLHKEAILAYFGTTARNLSLAPDIGAYIRGMDTDNPLILAPDRGAAAFAADVAAVGGWDSDYLQKVRISGDEVRMQPVTIDVASRTVVIVDDIISTGGTLATAATKLLEKGARAVHAVCVHGVFAGGAYGRLKSVGIESVAASDTIECGSSLFSAASCIAAGIRGC
ncbi:MAG: ribose-phosphate diphosphokinase [Methanomicrobiales archaeon]|nr:ribose-phosphate diphosphokinase [Methanomicrobiales archaeon]